MFWMPGMGYRVCGIKPYPPIPHTLIGQSIIASTSSSRMIRKSSLVAYCFLNSSPAQVVNRIVSPT